MNPTYHLYGIKITLDGDLEEAARRAHLVQKLMFQTKMLNVNNLDIIQNNLRLSDGTHVYVMSQHGFDSATIYVPPKPIVQVPRKRKRVEQLLWPAFHAYKSPSKYHSASEFVGIVLCKGGGFNSPYEFIPKDSLPRDTIDVPAGELKDERIWFGRIYENMTERMFEDIQPAGTETPIVVALEQYTYSSPRTRTRGGHRSRGWTSNHTNAGIWPDPTAYPDEWVSYHAEASHFYHITRTESYVQHFGLGANMYAPGWPVPVGTDSETWCTEYPWQPFAPPGGAKTDLVLNFPGDYSLISSGTGQSKFATGGFSIKSAKDDGLFRGEDGRMQVDPEASLEKTIAAAEALATAYAVSTEQLHAGSLASPPVGTVTVSYRSSVQRGEFTINIEQEYSTPRNVMGVIKDANAYALICQIYENSFYATNARVITDWWYATPPAESQSCSLNVNQSPITVYLDGEALGELPGIRLYYQYNNVRTARYFDILDTSGIGMFLVETTILPGQDLSPRKFYVYVDKNKGVITTETDDWLAPIPDVTDDDGDPVYVRAHVRLIRETVTYEEDL